jgi:Ribonuclease G/E
MCEGTGRLISKATVLTRIERWLMRYRFIGSERNLALVVHSEMQKFLTQGFRSRIRRLMWKYWMKIDVLPDDKISVEDFKFLSKRDGRELVI